MFYRKNIVNERKSEESDEKNKSKADEKMFYDPEDNN